MNTNRPQFFIRTLRLLLVVGMCCSLGMHWLALQTVAWTGMFIGFVNEAPLAEAVKKTFDGEHPCVLCKFVTTGSQQDQEQDDNAPSRSAKKLEAILASTALLPVLPLLDLAFTPETHRVAARAEKPPVPPPRA